MKDFIDEYKHLEKLCNEIYHQQHGITQYIEEMEQAPSHISRSISGWDNDLRELIRVRHIRNAMVHDLGADLDYDNNDIEYITDFYQRIFAGEDPLSQLRKKTKTVPGKRSNSPQIIETNKRIDSTKSERPKESSFMKWCLLAIIVLGFVALIWFLQ